MSVVTFAAMMISFIAVALGAKPLTLPRLFIALSIMFVHIGASYFYYTYSLTTIADSFSYYFQPWIWKDKSIGLSTVLLADFVQLLKVDFHATYLDCFMLFQSFGLLGMMLLARTFTGVQENIFPGHDRSYLWLFFLPSLNFWTSAIGKDALLFLSIALCLWSVLKLRTRILLFAASVTLMMLFRAHIALMAVVAMAVASMFGSSISIGRKFGLLAIATIGGYFSVDAVQNTLGLDVMSASAVGSFLDKQNSVYATVAGTTSLGNTAFPVRVFSLLFRPFFVDANGFLGIIASIENVFVVAAIFYLAVCRRELLHLMKNVFFIRFAAIFALLILFSLTLIYYNVGLGLRQRVMAYPMIMSILVALWSMRRRFELPRLGARLTVPFGGTVRSPVAEA